MLFQVNVRIVAIEYGCLQNAQKLYSAMTAE